MITHIALLRAINVGGNNKLPMAELVALARAAGATEARHFIQSGNLLLNLEGSAESFAVKLAAGIRAAKGFDAPVVVRSRAEWLGVLPANPFVDAPNGEVYIGFFDRPPDAAKVAALDPARSPGHRFRVVGREVYLHLPTGVAQTKLTNTWFDRQLGVVTTVRNWRTVEVLGEMSGS